MKVDDYAKFTFEGYTEYLLYKIRTMEPDYFDLGSDQACGILESLERTILADIKERKAQIEDAREGLKWLQGG